MPKTKKKTAVKTKAVKKKIKKEKVEKQVKKVKRAEAPRKVKKGFKFYKGTGRRKTATAQVRISSQGDKTVLVNEKSFEKYFPSLELRQIVLAPLSKMGCLDKFGITVKVRGGGIHSQAEAVRHGLTKALVLFNSEFRKELKKAGFLTRDSRMRERKKFGLKRARRAPQWAKR